MGEDAGHALGDVFPVEDTPTVARAAGRGRKMAGAAGEFCAGVRAGDFDETTARSTDEMVFRPGREKDAGMG